LPRMVGGRKGQAPTRASQNPFLLLPSTQEKFGIVAFDVLACATPVVTYRCGGPDRLPADSGAAILVDDYRAFRAAVEELLEGDVARAEMGAAARRCAVEKFSARTFWPTSRSSRWRTDRPLDGMFEMVRLEQIPRLSVACTGFVLRYERSKAVTARPGSRRG
jgi:hypothetical protein